MPSVKGQTDSTSNAFRSLYVTLSNQYVKHPDDVANLLDMATFYAHKDNPQHNYVHAAQYLQRAEELYTAWLQDRGRYRDMQKLIKKGITLTLIRQQRQRVVEQAEMYVQKHASEMGEEEKATYLVAFGDNAKIADRLRVEQVADEYQKVRRENTINGYYAFLIAHPYTPEADLAEQALGELATRYFASFSSESEIDSAAALYPSSSTMQYAAMKQKSRIAYYATVKTNTEEAYSSYMERYPRGDNYLDALSRLQMLRGMDYGMLRTPHEFADYAEFHSDDPLADSALARLRQMIKEEHSQEAARLYLERFPLDVHHSEVYKEYYGWYSAEGNKQPIEMFIKENPDYPYQMAIRSDLARSVVYDSVDLTKPFVESDFDRMTDCIHLFMGRKAAFVALQRVLQHQIARKDWSGARQRMQKFAICFEEIGTDEYNELLGLLSDNSGHVRKQLFSHGNIHHLFMNQASTSLYFTIGAEGGAVGLARLGAKGKDWKFAGNVHVEGATGSVTAFGFYDNDTKVLLGIDGDIWTAQVVNDTLWTNLQKHGYPVNTMFTETDAFMLADGSGMLLASDRPGGHNVQSSKAYYHGDTALATDLYFVPFTDGKWDEAVNLGMPVNTPYCELSPILSRNLRTLYFITDARGLGYGDVYMATRDDISDWSHWSRPVNLGKGVNGSFDEASISFMKKEKQLLLTSNSPQGGNYSGYSISTSHDTSSSHRTVTLDLAELEDVLRHVDVVDMQDWRVVYHFKDTDVDSIQQITLYKGKRYAVVAAADWLYSPTIIIDKGTKSEYRADGYMLEDMRGVEHPFPLPLVKFYNATSRLIPLSEKDLDNVVLFMRQHAGSQVRVSVHTKGNDDSQCYDLSMNRAISIRNYIVEQGIDASRILISAYGNKEYKKGGNPVEVEIRFQ